MRWSVPAASVMLLALTAAALTVALDARSPDTLLDALIAACMVVAAVLVGGTATVWFSLLRPFRTCGPGRPGYARKPAWRLSQRTVR